MTTSYYVASDDLVDPDLPVHQVIKNIDGVEYLKGTFYNIDYAYDFLEALIEEENESNS